MFIEGNATMIVLVPLLAPVAAQYGIDEIHFAMVYIFNNAIGALSETIFKILAYSLALNCS